MDIQVYLEPVSKKVTNNEFAINSMGTVIKPYSDVDDFPNINSYDIAIIGIPEDRHSINNKGCAEAPDFIRKYLYSLFAGNYNAKIVDLGNIKRGFEVNDTYFAVSTVVGELIKNNVLPIIIGGSQDLTYANYLAYENLGQIINIASVDNSFDLGKNENEINAKSYLSNIILHQPNFLFIFSNIGYQTYFVDQDAIELMKRLYFDAYRLGIVRANIEEVEPIVRNADILSFDVSAIRFSDAPGNYNATPNGFYGEEACQITRYAGLSDKLSSIGFYEINPERDNHDQTCHLVAQMIWYFIDGFYNRKKDFPLKDKTDYIKYRVSIQDNKYEVVFYKSKKSDRWWMDVPYSLEFEKFQRHHLVPCSYKDYETALKEEIPDRWWQSYQKLT